MTLLVSLLFCFNKFFVIFNFNNFSLITVAVIKTKFILENIRYIDYPFADGLQHRKRYIFHSIEKKNSNLINLLMYVVLFLDHCFVTRKLNYMEHHIGY